MAEKKKLMAEWWIDGVCCEAEKRGDRNRQQRLTMLTGTRWRHIDGEGSKLIVRLLCMLPELMVYAKLWSLSEYGRRSVVFRCHHPFSGCMTKYQIIMMAEWREIELGLAKVIIKKIYSCNNWLISEEKQTLHDDNNGNVDGHDDRTPAFHYGISFDYN